MASFVSLPRLYLCISPCPRPFFPFFFQPQGTFGILGPCACGLRLFSRVQLFATPWTVARQAPLSMGFSRQEYQSELPCPPPGDLPNPGIEPMSLLFPALAGQFFTTSASWGAPLVPRSGIKPLSLAVEPWILNPWAARKVPLSSSYKDPGHCLRTPAKPARPPPQVSHLLQCLSASGMSLVLHSPSDHGLLLWLHCLLPTLGVHAALLGRAVTTLVPWQILSPWPEMSSPSLILLPLHLRSLPIL